MNLDDKHRASSETAPTSPFAQWGFPPYFSAPIASGEARPASTPIELWISLFPTAPLFGIRWFFADVPGFDGKGFGPCNFGVPTAPSAFMLGGFPGVEFPGVGVSLSERDNRGTAGAATDTSSEQSGSATERLYSVKPLSSMSLAGKRFDAARPAAASSRAERERRALDATRLSVAPLRTSAKTAKTTAKAEAKPAAKSSAAKSSAAKSPASKSPADKSPASKAAAKAPAKTVAKTVAKTGAKTGAKTATKSAAKSVAKTAGESASKSAAKASGKPAAKASAAAGGAAPKAAAKSARSASKSPAKAAAQPRAAARKTADKKPADRKPAAARLLKGMSRKPGWPFPTYDAAPANADDLTRINGVGDKLAAVLNDRGIFTYRQIAAFDEKAYQWLDETLGAFKGRGKRDDWAGQAAALLKKK